MRPTALLLLIQLEVMEVKMEISGLQCNDCGVKVLSGSGQLDMWATLLVTVPSMRLERRLHFCPQCFTTWNNGLHHEAVRIDADLARALGQEDPELFRLLQEEEEIERRATSAPHSPPTGEAAIPPPPPVKSRGKRNAG
jgi:hypothetical protein